MKNLQDIVEKQRAFAKSGHAKNISFRRQQLQKLKDVLKKNEDLLFKAIDEDFKKSNFDTYMTELGLIYHEINLALKNVDEWARPRAVNVGLLNFPARGFILPEPYGTTLIIGAWNYPYQLTLGPLVGAMVAGNTSLLKPSELSVRTSAVLAKIINENFDPAYLHVIEGGVETNQELLRHAFDKIFFTGSTFVGKIVAKAAAEHLTPVTLELGGKSPCFVFKDADLKRAAQRILWGKFLNAGQTCIAPDYLLVEKPIYNSFLQELQLQLSSIVGQNPKESASYTRIINRRHLDRLQKLMDPKKIFAGGQVLENENYIEPTILKDVVFSDAIMQEEIFGPLLPILCFDHLESVLNEVKSRPKPLSLYIFSKSLKIQNRLLKELSFGGGCINDVVMHIGSSDLPFGGVGASGMGNYHGEAGFKTFSHMKSILKKPNWIEVPIKYAPYSDWKMKLIRLFMS